jgi:hypothetical protein
MGLSEMIMYYLEKIGRLSLSIIFRTPYNAENIIGQLNFGQKKEESPILGRPPLKKFKPLI